MNGFYALAHHKPIYQSFRAKNDINHFACILWVSFRHKHVIDYQLFCHLSSFTHNNWSLLIHCNPDILAKSADFPHYYLIHWMQYVNRAAPRRRRIYIKRNLLTYSCRFFMIIWFSNHLCHMLALLHRRCKGRRRWVSQKQHKKRDSCIMYTYKISCIDSHLFYFVISTRSHLIILFLFRLAYVVFFFFKVSREKCPLYVHSRWTPVNVHRHYYYK